MTAPVDKREWLAERGLAIAGARGKFSAKAHEALEKAVTDGVVFAEKGVNTVTRTRIVDGEEVTETKVVDPFAPTAEPIRSGRINFTNGKETISVNSAEACEHCKHSFGWCYCAEPAYRYWRNGEVYTLSV